MTGGGGATAQTRCTREELDKLDSDLVRKALAAYDAETAKWEREAYHRQVVREWKQACERARAEHPKKVEQAEAAGKKPPRLRLPRKPGDPRAGWSPPAGMFQATVWPIRKPAVRGALYHLGEFQDTDDWMRRYIQKANPEVAGKVKQLQAQVEQLKAEIGKMDE